MNSELSTKFVDVVDPSDITVTTDSSRTSNENVIIPTDRLVHHLVEQISDLLTKSATENDRLTPVHLAKASTLLSTLTDGDNQQLLTHLIRDYFQSKTRIDVATQVIEEKEFQALFFFPMKRDLYEMLTYRTRDCASSLRLIDNITVGTY